MNVINKPIEISLSDLLALGCDFKGLDYNIDKQIYINQLMDKLKPIIISLSKRDRKILNYYFIDNLSLQQIKTKLNGELTREGIRLILVKILNRFRSELGAPHSTRIGL